MVIRRDRRRGGVVTDRAIYVDRDGNEVSPNSPNVHQQIIGKGGVLSAEDAKRFGITGGKIDPTLARPEDAPMVTMEAARAADLEAAGANQRDRSADRARIRELEARVRELESANPGDDDAERTGKDGMTAAEHGGTVGKEKGAPENKSGVPSVTETKDATPDDKGKADTSQAQSGTTDKRKT